jgi:hypothetical protein
MGNYFGINDREFWRWWDKLGKKLEPGRPDLGSREEALEKYEEWVEEGKPDSEGHRTEPPSDGIEKCVATGERITVVIGTTYLVWLVAKQVIAIGGAPFTGGQSLWLELEPL